MAFGLAVHRAGSRQYYEDGAQLEFAYPNFTSPTARLTVLRNPPYGAPYETRSLAQSLTETPTGRVVAAAIADVPAKRIPLRWEIMPTGWIAGQRIKSTGTLLLTSTTGIATGTAYDASIGFRNFSATGTAPTTLALEELDSMDNVLATHDLAPSGGGALLQYPQGTLRRLKTTFTSDGSLAKFRWKITSSGEDFLVADPSVSQLDGTESFPESSHYLDGDSDGIGGGWSASGSPPTAEFYAEDWYGLDQWIELVARGALEQFEVRRQGTGQVVTCRLIEPLERVEAPIHSSGMVSGVQVTLLRVDS